MSIQLQRGFPRYLHSNDGTITMPLRRLKERQAPYCTKFDVIWLSIHDGLTRGDMELEIIHLKLNSTSNTCLIAAHFKNGTIQFPA